MQKKYIVRLTEDERETLAEVVAKFHGSSQKVRRAQVLLKADAAGPAWTDARIAEAFGCRTKTVENIRERFVVEGFDVTLHGKPRETPPAKLLDGEQEAKLIAMRLGSPPAGFSNWTLRLLAEQVVALDIVEKISFETVRRTLKKKDDEVEDRVVGDSAGCGQRIRGEHGRRARRLQPGVRCSLSRVVHGRAGTASIFMFYEAFGPAEARAIVARLEFHHTPKHGSWLNIAENELNSITRQCVEDRRFATIEDLRKETSTWAEHTNKRQHGVDRQVHIDAARRKLKSVYSKIVV